MILHHLILDTPTLVALSGNRQVSALVHRAHFETETRLWVPTLSVLEADREYLGIAEHVGQLEVLHTVDLDYSAALAVAQLHRDGVSPGIGAAIHAARHLPEWGADALVATVHPKAYEGRGVPVLDLNR
ncbi:hypothetical protein ACFWBB_17800 [Streptomyces sp. NPDC060000]|uniref:hypothetical protein n=1 Tax=Streptomyces sp. NPDC060000 TaxID=3347031 RepID=UPI0036AE6069